jgi:hypothetical protein
MHYYLNTLNLDSHCKLYSKLKIVNVELYNLYFSQNIVTIFGGLRDLQTGFELDDWIYRHLIHITPDYRQYSAIADLQILQFTVTYALGLSVFSSRTLATDLYKGRIKSSGNTSIVLK